MKLSKAEKIILIENPLTGNDSFSRAFKLSGNEKWASPLDIREAEDTSKIWDKFTKVILVRDPVDRFLSGCALLINSEEKELKELGVSEEFLSDKLPKIKEASKEDKAITILEEIKGEEITFFLPQSNWLKSKFDLVICTRDLAQYFSSLGLSVKRSPKFASSNGWEKVDFNRNDGELLKIFSETYKADLELFETMLVWSAKPDKLRFVKGDCLPCEEKLKKANEEKASKEDKPKTVKRARKSTKSTK